MRDDLIDWELQELVGASTISQLRKEASAPEIVFDESELSVPVFKSTSGINMEEEVQLGVLLQDFTGMRSEDATKIAGMIGERRALLRPTPMAKNSRHREHIQGMVDSVKRLPVFARVKKSDGWDRLVQSCVNFVEGELARVV